MSLAVGWCCVASRVTGSSNIPPVFAADGLTARLPDTEGRPENLEQWRGKVRGELGLVRAVSAECPRL